MAEEKFEELDISIDEVSELSDADLDEIAGGAQIPATKSCPVCGSVMTLKGASGHYVYYCKNCKKLFKA